MLQADRHRLVNAIAIVLLLCSLSVAHGQGEDREENARDFRERVQRMKLNKLVEVLRLGDERELDFRKTYAEQQRKVEEARDGLDAATDRLQRLLRSDAPPAQITTATDETTRAVTTLLRAQEQRAVAVRPTLTPAQYARYVLFELRFQEILRRIMKRQREQR
ncbi:MAG: hypothetical protein ACKO9V_06595 [Candidatus Kapaibacterium sp.]